MHSWREHKSVKFEWAYCDYVQGVIPESECEESSLSKDFVTLLQSFVSFSVVAVVVTLSADGDLVL